MRIVYFILLLLLISSCKKEEAISTPTDNSIIMQTNDGVNTIGDFTLSYGANTVVEPSVLNITPESYCFNTSTIDSIYLFDQCTFTLKSSTPFLKPVQISLEKPTSSLFSYSKPNDVPYFYSVVFDSIAIYQVINEKLTFIAFAHVQELNNSVLLDFKIQNTGNYILGVHQKDIRLPGGWIDITFKNEQEKIHYYWKNVGSEKVNTSNVSNKLLSNENTFSLNFMDFKGSYADLIKDPSVADFSRLVSVLFSIPKNVTSSTAPSNSSNALLIYIPIDGVDNTFIYNEALSGNINYDIKESGKEGLGESYLQGTISTSLLNTTTFSTYETTITFRVLNIQ